MKADRVMLAAVNSGSGKTTITCALLKACKSRARKTRAFKCGPDYIDPMFHRTVLGIESANLDSFFQSEEGLLKSFGQDCEEDSVSIVEGVMGLYDGLAGIKEEGSSYDIARILQIPIILIVDAHGMGRSLLPLLSGFLQYDREHLIKGVILNRVGASFAKMITPDVEELGIRVLGCFPKQNEVSFGSRHLGLILPEEIEDVNRRLELAAKTLEENVDMEAVFQVAGEAKELPSYRKKTAPVYMKKEIPIAIARDEAFCFYYRENIKLLEEFGAKPVFFSPIHDKKLPEGIQGLLLYGGYPELYAKELEENEEMRMNVREKLELVPSLAECGGFMYLHQSIETAEQKTFSMVGAVPGKVYYTGKPVRFGYLSLEEKVPLFLENNTQIRGHEYHYFESTASGEACIATKPITQRNWECILEGERHFWGFPHLYYPSNPSFVSYFIHQCRKG